MVADLVDYKNSREKVIAYCKDLIEYYKSNRVSNRNAWYLSQTATVILSAITPLLILVEAPKLLQAFPPALASVTGGLGVFRWRENWVIGKCTQENLEAELVAFEVGATDFYRELKEEEAIDNFLDRINTLHLTKVKQWSTLIMKDQSSHQKNTNQDSQNTPLLDPMPR